MTAAAVRDQLAQAKALLVTARFKAGLELADAALTRAGPLADLPLTAEVRLMQGELLNALGHIPAPRRPSATRSSSPNPRTTIRSPRD